VVKQNNKIINEKKASKHVITIYPKIENKSSEEIRNDIKTNC
jgi:hypothetical protein